MYRQGDILIVPVKSILAGLKKVEREAGRIVLAHGEVTGHAHTISDDRSAMFRDEKLNKLFLRADGDYRGPIAGQLVEINHERGWFLAQTDLRLMPVKFSLAHASIDDGIIECGPFTLIDHDEHNPCAIPNGNNNVIRQREYSPGAIRSVAD